MKKVLLIIFFCSVQIGWTQELDPDLKAIMERLETVLAYEAEVTFDVDISFIKMPTKKAILEFHKGDELKFDSDDFILIPKKGLDFSLIQLLEVPVLSVNRGTEVLDGKTYKVVNLIPTSDQSDFAIAKLLLDIQNLRVQAAEISTKKEGVYWIDFDFENANDILPNKVMVEFEVEKFRLPINFMGKDTAIDRKQMRQQGPKKGAIYLAIQYQNLKLAPVLTQ